MVVFAPDHKSSCLAISQNRSREGHPPMMMFHCTEIITLYLLPPCLHCFANCSNRFFRSLIFRHTAKILFCNLFFSSSLCYDAGRSKSIFFQFEFGFDKFFVLLHSIKHHNFSLWNFLRHCFAHQCAHFPICFSHIIISSFVFIFVVVRWMTNGRVT